MPFWRHEVIARAHLPAATHGTVDRDQVLRNLAAGPGVLVLLGQQAALGIEHTLEVNGALAVLDDGDIERTPCGFHAALQVTGVANGAAETGNAVLDLARSLQHGILVAHDLFLEPGILDANLVFEPAVVEDGPGESRADAVAEAVSAEQVAEVAAIGVAGDNTE